MFIDWKIIEFRCFNTISSYINSYVTGIVILTSKLKFILIKDIYNSKLLKFPDIPGRFLKYSYDVLKPFFF
jgi:hypothetical protein